MYLDAYRLHTIIYKRKRIEVWKKNIAIHFQDQALRLLKLFAYSSQLSMKLVMLINVKMPTIVGILTFISMINTTSEG